MAVKYKRRYGGYGPLKTKKGRGVKKYKNVNNYLNALYNNNKEYLDEHIKTFGDSRKKREIFKEEVMSRLGKINPDTGKKYTLKQAIDKVQRSTLITTQEERIGEVHLTRMRELDPEQFKKFRQAVGWTNKVSSKNFVEELHDGNKYYLRYKDDITGKDVIIVEVISPKGSVIGWEIMTYDEFVEKYMNQNQNNSAKDQARYGQWKRYKK